MNLLKRSWLLLTISILTIISSCQKDIDMFVPDNIIPGNIVNPSPVNASVQGKVVDQANNPVSGATVKAGVNMTTTDSRGLFRFNHINIDKYASVITVEANGYFKGIRTFSAEEGSSNFVRLKLLTKTLVGDVDAAAGGTVTLADNSQVIFSAASVVVKSTGAIYTGAVKVYAANIDPTSPDIAETVPGSFQAQDESNYRVILKSFGMLAVQLESPTGEQLQIATGKTAKLHVVIPASLVATAPASLPLWYMDETTGLWKQQGTASKTGNVYDGDVSHFSFWNCDVASNTIFFEVTVNTVNGPLPNAVVKLTRISNGGASFGITDSAGHVGGLVFMNEQMTLEVFDNCYEVIHTQNIGPFGSNTNLGSITVPVASQNSLLITGSAVDCSNLPVNNGTALIFFEGYPYLRPIVNGQYSANILRCSNSTQPVTVIVTDNATQQQSTAWTGSASSTGIVNVDTLSACSVITTGEFINYSMNGINFSFTPPNASFFHSGSLASNAVISAINSTNSDNCNINFSNDSIGLNHSQQLLSFQSNMVPLTPLASPVYVVITEYGAVGEFIAGTFAAELYTQQPPTATYFVNCSFRIRRAY